MELLSTRPPVLVPFVCPVCAAPNSIELIALSRAGGTACTGCKRYLRSSVVMRAMHAPRAPGHQPPPTRTSAPEPAMVWPPTPESRAAVAPLSRRRDGARN